MVFASPLYQATQHVNSIMGDADESEHDWLWVSTKFLFHLRRIGVLRLVQYRPGCCYCT